MCRACIFMNVSEYIRVVDRASVDKMKLNYSFQDICYNNCTIVEVH